MKRILLMAAALVVALSAAAQNNEKYPSYIDVTGRAEREIVPDEFYLSIVINERDSKGKISVEQQQREMIATLRRLSIDTDKQLKVSNLSSEFYRKNSSVAQAKYQLKLASAADVAKAWAALDALGISNVSILRVAHSEIDRLKEEVRLDAIRNARQCATSMAEAIGQHAGKCFYIYDSNHDVMPARYDNISMAFSTRAKMMDEAEEAGMAAGAETPEFKTIKLNYSVQARFVLE